MSEWLISRLALGALRPLRLGLTILALAAQPGLSQTVTPPGQVLTPAQEAAVRALVLQTIRDNPAIVGEALQTLQTQAQDLADAQAKDALKAQEANLFADPNAPVIGNPAGDVTVVEFFDYNCPYCKKAAPEVAALIAQDPMVRVVLREWPILGPDSDYSARAALAVRAQGKFAEFHAAMMGQQRANEATVRRVAADLGIDMTQLAADMNAPEVAAHLDLSNKLAAELGISGTPGFVIGDTIIPGFVPYQDLELVVASVRANLESTQQTGSGNE